MFSGVSYNLKWAIIITFLIHLGHYTCVYLHAIQTSHSCFELWWSWIQICLEACCPNWSNSDFPVPI